MKIILILCLVSNLAAQKDPYFLTTISIEDAVGNKKQIEIGYDTLANSCDINAEFGEVLDNTEFDSVFDVRVANYYTWGGRALCGRAKKLLFSKKIVGGGERIISNHLCIGGDKLIFFIHAKHQPITIRWDPLEFEKINCRNANWSFFTPDLFRNALFNHNWVAINPRYACIKEGVYTFFLGPEHLRRGEEAYLIDHPIQGKGITPIYGMSLHHDQTFFYCDKNYVGVEDKQSHVMEPILFPNPITNYVNIKFDSELELPNTIMFDVMSLDGRIVVSRQITKNENLFSTDVSYLQSGIYLYQLREANRSWRKVGKFVKME